MRLIVAHCGRGGALPAMTGRLGMLGGEPWVPNPNALTAEEIQARLRRFYLDTAATGFASSLAPALVMTTPDHLVYGSASGVPFSTEETVEANRQALLDCAGLTRHSARQSAATPRRCSRLPQPASTDARPRPDLGPTRPVENAR
jgi:hypothetical protein